jgi:hypothetical protein
MATTPKIEAPSQWIADLLASKAQIERGETVLMQPVIDRMQASINRIRNPIRKLPN